MSFPMHTRFTQLHERGSLLLLANAWDAASAALWERAGASAIGTSSAAMAWACGYADGGCLPQASLLERIRDMVRVTSVPLSIDLEDGYSDAPDAVASLVRSVAELGVAGINLEDGAGAPERLEAKIRSIRKALQGQPLFINARSDVYLRGIASGMAAVEMTVARLARYREAGADGAFVPCIRDLDEIAAIADAVPMPLNVMVVPGLPAIEALRQAGVRRVSAGPSLFLQTFGEGLNLTQRFLAGDLRDPPTGTPGYAELNAMFA